MALVISLLSTQSNHRRIHACHAIIPARTWSQFSELLPERPRFVTTHPLGCHREAIPDRVVFEAIVRKLVFGTGYERSAEPGCSDWVIRDRVKKWTALNLAQELWCLTLFAYDRMIGLRLDDSPADGCITKAPAKSQISRPSPSTGARAASSAPP